MNLAEARTFLFVPGDRPDRFAKAAAAGADVVVVDLEDAVAPADKAAARAHAVAWLAAGNEAVVRVNAAGTPWHAEDVAALAGAPLMLPKAEHAADVERAGPVVVALVESAAGVAAAREVCGAAGVVRVAFGSIDLAAELGVDPASHTALLHARSALVLAAAAAGGPPPVDGVTTALDDPAAIRRDTAHAVELGFTGKLCVHPRQIEPVHAALRPSEEDIEWARRVLAASAAGSATAVDGRLVDRPVVLRARRLLSRAGRTG
ncbi:MAG TPA: CoA ester lyase [Actinophytocola sp.]|uniref:HpcH/HpaI aldolase/citrate lyase family protein n=1 Tax=Actinophytocola sp. TaxID=1872138 RepID=UPI002F927556